MTTSALITMITVQLFVTVVAIFFMVKVLTKEKSGTKTNQ